MTTKRTPADLRARRMLKRLRAIAEANESKRQNREACERYSRREEIIVAKGVLC